MGGRSYFYFYSPKNAFGTYLIDIADNVPVTVTLMTNDGQSEVHTIIQESDGQQQNCNVILYGIKSSMNFDMVVLLELEWSQLERGK